MNKPLIFVVGEPEVHAVLASLDDLEVFPRHWDSLGAFLAAAKRREIPGDHSPTVIVLSEAARQQDTTLDGFVALVRSLVVLVPWHGGQSAVSRHGVVGVDLPLTVNGLRAAIGARAGIVLSAIAGGDEPIHVPGFQEQRMPMSATTGAGPGSLDELSQIFQTQPERPRDLAPATPPTPAPPAPAPAPHAPQGAPRQPQVAPRAPQTPVPAPAANPGAWGAGVPGAAAPVGPSRGPGPGAPPSGGATPYPVGRHNPGSARPLPGSMGPGHGVASRGAQQGGPAFSSTKVIAVYSSKGGVGKSTMSLNLAARLAYTTDLEVCVVDLDVGFGDIGPRLGKFQPTVIEALREPQLDGDSIMTSLVREDSTGMYALLAPLRPDTGADRSLLHPSAYERILRALRQRFHVVFLDCSVDLADPLVGQFALTRSDAIAVVVNNERATLLDAKRALEAMCRPSQGARPGLGIAKDKIGLLLNQRVDKVTVGERDIRQLLPDFPIVASVPDNRQLWVGEANLGRLLATAGIPEIDDALDDALMAFLPGLELESAHSAHDVAPTRRARGGRSAQPIRDDLDEDRGRGGRRDRGSQKSLIAKLLGR